MDPYKFVPHDVAPLEHLKGSWVYEVHARRQELSREEKDRLVRQLQTNRYSRRGVPLRGWMFPFDDVLKTFLAKVRHYGWREVYAPDKTSVRSFFGSHNVFHIVELDHKGVAG